MKNNEIELGMQFERFLVGLFGNRYQGFIGECNYRDWKKINQQICNAIDSAIKHFVVKTDVSHKEELMKTSGALCKTVKNSKTIEEINLYMIIYLTRLCLLLIGRVPDNYRKQSSGAVKYWKLDPIPFR